MANEKHTDEEIKKIKEMESFIKSAFCIDGDCNYIETVDVISTLCRTTGSHFVVTDSKRGRFYVTITK